MTISKNFKSLLIALALTSLTACSTMNKSSDEAGAMAGDPSGVSTAGLGNDSSFGGRGSGNPMQVGEQTYYFDFDKSFVHDNDRPSIEVQARYLASHPNAKVLLEGHTDPRGSREYNIGLGERRGVSIEDVLKLQGVNKNQIRVVSYGAEKLAATGSSEEDYQLDRRVHLVYEDKG